MDARINVAQISQDANSASEIPTESVIDEFGFTPIELYEKYATDKKGAITSYNYDGFTAYQVTIVGTRIISFTKPDSDKVFTISVVCDGANNNTWANTYADSVQIAFAAAGYNLTLSGYIDQVGGGVAPANVPIDATAMGTDISYISTSKNNYETGVLSIKPSGCQIDIRQLPTTVDRQPDLLRDDDARQTFRMQRLTYNYANILDAVDAYIDNERPLNTDNAFKIKNIVREIVELMAKCSNVVDEFEGEATLFYAGIDEITQDTCFVPSISGNDDIDVRVGFVADDWLFFDHIRIKVTDDEYITDSFKNNTIRDVLSGGKIKESAIFYCDDEDANEILNATVTPTLRFDGKDDKVRDHTISAEELEALKTLLAIKNLDIEFRDMLNDWEDGKI